MFEHITFTNFIIAMLLPAYVCGVAYCIGYGYHKGKAFWERDYWFFIDAMEQCKLEEEMKMDIEREKVIKEEIANGTRVRPAFIPQLRKKDEPTIH